jgi:hypothetical protein
VTGFVVVCAQAVADRAFWWVAPVSLSVGRMASEPVDAEAAGVSHCYNSSENATHL